MMSAHYRIRSSKRPITRDSNSRGSNNSRDSERKLTNDEVNHLVTRLSRATTAHAMRSRFYSNDRVEYDKREEEKAKKEEAKKKKKVKKGPEPILLHKEEEQTEDTIIEERRRDFPKFYPGLSVRADEEEMNEIIQKVNKPTHCSEIRNHRDENDRKCDKCHLELRSGYKWHPAPKSAQEREELTQRLLEGTYVHRIRIREAQLRRSEQPPVYFIELPYMEPYPKKCFVRGGLRYKLE